MVTPVDLPPDVVGTPAWMAFVSHPVPDAIGPLIDDRRLAGWVLEAAGVRVDLSRHLLDDRGRDLGLAVVRAAGLESARAAMFAGERINTTEDRAVLHTALRAGPEVQVSVDGIDAVATAREVRAAMAAFARAVRADPGITDIVNIGIGGSDLGPRMATEALAAWGDPGRRVHFVANVDGADLAAVLGRLDPGRTLFVVVSKTFTTAETLLNARSARAWLVAALGEAAVADHFAAVSTNLAAVAAFGIRPERTFEFWDWVGGRYSLASAVGLSLMLAIGPEAFEEMLAGMRDMDHHFLSAPLERNAPVLMALLGIWYLDVLGHRTKAVVPYAQELARFPAYLQQLDMESNGKSVRRDGGPVRTATGPVIWGEPGTNGQHAFFQLLHQGTEVVPTDLIGFARSNHPVPGHHEVLLANLLAQAEALAHGRPDPAAPWKSFAGGRPTTVILAEQLTPHSLGALIALYEQVVFVQGVVWGLNSFDQWGVELGKELALRLAPALRGETPLAAVADPATRAALAWIRAVQDR